jgi:hypothetical protein
VTRDSKKPDGPERRQHARFAPDKYRLSLKKSGIGGLLGKGADLGSTLVDLSENGAQVVSTQALKPGAKVKVIVFLEKFGDSIDAEGTVRWVRAGKPDRWHCGLLFSGLSDDDRRKLANNASWFTSEMYLAKKKQKERESLGFF